MPEESTTPDLAELVQRYVGAFERRDFDAVEGCFAPDAVGVTQLSTFEGAGAIRGFLEDVWSSYEESRVEVEELLSLRNGVGFFVLNITGRMAGSRGEIRLRIAVVAVVTVGLVESYTDYLDIDEARAAAERLAEERGQAVPEESTSPDRVELVRRLNEAFKAPDADTWSSFVTPDVVHRPIATFTAKEFRGRDAVWAFRDEWDDAWADDFVSPVETIREYGGAVIALVRFSGHARASGIEIRGGVFQVFRFRDGLVARIEDFTDRADALKAAGLEE
jgi:ketosteroid isomerase-like protein